MLNFRFIPIFLALINLSGCYGYRVIVNDPDPVTEYQSETAHSLVWGLIQIPQDVVATNCHSNSIDEVYIQSNLGYSFVTVLTLGLWAPLEIQWRCAEKPTENTVL